MTDKSSHQCKNYKMYYMMCDNENKYKLFNCNIYFSVL